MLKLTLSSKPVTMDEPSVRIRQLSEQANHEIDFSRPIRMYYRSGLEMVRMANVYAEEGNLTAAYVLYLKFITIFVEKIRSHPEYRQVTATEKLAIKRYLEKSLSRAETIKQRLRARFDDEYRTWLAEQKRQEEELARQRQIEDERSRKKMINEQERRRFEEDKKKLLESERKRVEELERSLSVSANASSSASCYADLLPSPPSAPPSSQHRPASSPLSSHANHHVVVPSVDRSSKPLYSGSMSLLSLRSELRTVVVPDQLMARFLDIAKPNTTQNVETCALLCGKPSGDLLHITHLIVPRQTGGPDWCTTEGEEYLLEHMERHSLITMGWIHTHPSQTAFLSSMDLHTHYSHQICMAESIAIVCAPKYDETGFYHLTPDYGLNFIASCSLTGFHPHPSQPALFTEAQHVTLDSETTVTVLDLRQ